MQYTTIPILKTVQCPNGHLFQIPVDFSVGRCPSDGVLVTTPINPILNFRVFHNDILTTVGNIISFLIISPNTLTRIHMNTNIIADSDIQYDIFESPITSTNGTLLFASNADRNTDIIPPYLAPSLQIFFSPTVTSNGINIWSRKNPQGLFSPFLMRDISPENEFVLKQNTKYLLKITALAKATSVSTGINWLEVR